MGEFKYTDVLDRQKDLKLRKIGSVAVIGVGGVGVAFMSTSKGVMTGQQARREGVGGELLFYIW